GNNSAAAAGASQFPSLVIAMGMTSYFDLSIASMTELAERIETSCSPERPPKITPMRSFFGMLLSPVPLGEGWVSLTNHATLRMRLSPFSLLGEGPGMRV